MVKSLAPNMEGLPLKRNKCNDEETLYLKVKKLSENGYAPTRGSTEAAGYDLYRYFVNYTIL